MATALCKTDLGTGSEAARYPLVADGSHLFIIKHESEWTNKSLRITPSEEYFSQAVTWAEDSAYDTQMGSNNQAALAMQERLAAIRNAKTVDSWIEGHRPLFAYWARSFPPYRIKADANIDYNKLYRTMELASCWRLLKFSFRGLPAGLVTGLTAWWRVWNPSCLFDQFIPAGVSHSVKTIGSLYNGAGVMRYKFASEAHAPSFHEDTGYGSADICAVANDGTSSNQVSANSNCILYDIWGSHNGVASATNNYYGQEHIRIWAQSGTGGVPDRTPYYADIPITGDGLDSLKAALAGRGAVWAHCGFPITDAQSSWQSGMTTHYGQDAYTTLFIYCSRLELRVRFSWDELNNS